MGAQLYDLFLFLLGLGFMEVVVKPVVSRYFRKTLFLLPDIFDKLDPLMPSAIADLTPDQMSDAIKGVISGEAKNEGITLSDKQKEKLFKEFIRLYDPTKAALKVKE